MSGSDPTLRHPWHPVFVHFPISCWVIAFAVEAVYVLVPTVPLPFGMAPGAFAITLLWLGNLTALATMTTGLVDMVKLPDKAALMATLYKHMAWMGLAWVLMLGAALLRFLDQGWKQPSGLAVLAAELAAVGCLMAGGFQASRLVYHMHLGKLE